MTLPRHHSRENDPVIVSQAVLDGLEMVRKSGIVNMLDRPAVVMILHAAGCYEAADWCEHHKSDYARGIFAGFAAQEEERRVS